MERALKSVKAAGVEHARIVMDLEKRTIEIIFGPPDVQAITSNPWDEV